MSTSAIGLIFRVPEKGKVKKRLEKLIGVEKTFFYYKNMLDETINKLLILKDVDFYGFYKGDRKKIAYNINLIEQRSNDLGEIILDAISSLKNKGYEKTVILGSDSPDLPLEFITKTFEYLDDFDVVLGPSEDGGFYLLGCNKNFDAEVLKNVDWGGPTVLSTIKDNLMTLKLNFQELPFWYDIDGLDSLKRWLNNHNSISSRLFSNVKSIISPFDSLI